ncbi:hypothetical protein I4641_22730 [Waterburya agarophytonicola K14]|uniref:Uncharacterized protein n=1 Tax=Waterburya agarophytonicola KI4 TaxID=2874699 RepID=A0A964C044_9CYAN|nr:hypothetical protein [Waterburya agarophytonicola]MCC0179761.1 hypothetical protein [Waterburya agarophytonicola KI4]
MSRIKQRLLALLILLAGLKLCFPIYRHIYKLYIRSSQEQLKVGWEIPKETEQNNSPEQFESQHQPPQRLADDAEIIFVSGYKSERNLNSDKVKVNIDRPYKNVLLVLSSYDRVNWDVEASPNTNITGIVLGSNRSSTIVANTNSREVYTADFPYSYEIENKNFVAALEQLNRWFEVDKIDAFRGSYALPGVISISELDPIDPALTLAGYPIEKSTTNSQFDFSNCNYESVKWMSRGAIARSKYIRPQTGIAVSPDRKEIYKLTKAGKLRRT